MNQLKTIVHNALQSSFSRMIEGETREWPPKCLAFLYQPQRPKITGSADKTSDVAISKQDDR